MLSKFLQKLGFLPLHAVVIGVAGEDTHIVDAFVLRKSTCCRLSAEQALITLIVGRIALLAKRQWPVAIQIRNERARCLTLQRVAARTGHSQCTIQVGCRHESCIFHYREELESMGASMLNYNIYDLINTTENTQL